MTTSPAHEGPGPLSPVVAERIRGLRAERRWSQAEAAIRTGLSRSGLSDRENGVKAVNIDELPVIAAAFEVSIPYLLGLTETRGEVVSQREPIGTGSVTALRPGLRLVPPLEPLPDEVPIEPAAIPSAATEAGSDGVVVAMSAARRRLGSQARSATGGGPCLVLELRLGEVSA